MGRVFAMVVLPVVVSEPLKPALVNVRVKDDDAVIVLLTITLLSTPTTVNALLSVIIPPTTRFGRSTCKVAPPDMTRLQLITPLRYNTDTAWLEVTEPVRVGPIMVSASVATRNREMAELMVPEPKRNKREPAVAL
jgi:hypothetical protein